MRDPSTTFDQLKSLRLVCKGSNHVAAPRVLSCVRLFGNGDNPVSNIRQLHAIVSSNLNGHLYVTNTLVLDWKWKYNMCDTIVRLHARYRLPRALVLNMPNVSRVM